MFVACTPGAKLQKMLQEAEDKFIEGTKLKRIRVVERCGQKLKDILCARDPWERDRCEREDCLPCLSCSDRPGVGCQTENITYTIRCRECARRGTSAMYWGESARTGFKRGKEHVEGLFKEWEKAPLWRHSSTFHNGTKELAWYEMRVVRSHRTPLNRQVDEGVEIALCTADIVMNSTAELNGTRIPRIVIEEREKQTRTRIHSSFCIEIDLQFE